MAEIFTDQTIPTELVTQQSTLSMPLVLSENKKKPLLTEFKKLFVYLLIGSLSISGFLAAFTVIVGEFSEVTSRVFFTLAMVVIHSLISLLFIWDDERENTFQRLSFFINVLFILIVTSFFTSIFGIWKIILGSTVWKLYQLYFVLGFASLHGDILSKILHKEKYMDAVIFSNYVFMIFVVIMILPTIFIDIASAVLPELYYRILGALGIIDGTLSVLAIIFYRLYIHKHPNEKSVLTEGGNDGNSKKGFGVWVWILVTYLVAQVLFSLVFNMLAYKMR